jgi:outer membrane immunogenic protein
MMRRLVIALLASTALAGTASAADLARKSVPYTPVPAAPTWTGFYVGGFIGYGWGSDDWTNSDESWSNFSPDFDGFLGGLQIGYDYQFPTNFIVGVQADIAWASLEGSSSYAGTYDGGAGRFSGTVKSESQWISTLTGRIGFSADRALFYIKGGAAWADFSHSNQLTDRFTDGELGPETTDYYGKHSDTRSGWTLGFGVEYAFAPNWGVPRV